AYLPQHPGFAKRAIPGEEVVGERSHALSHDPVEPAHLRDRRAIHSLTIVRDWQKTLPGPPLRQHQPRGAPDYVWRDVLRQRVDDRQQPRADLEWRNPEGRVAIVLHWIAAEFELHSFAQRNVIGDPI